MPRDQGKLGSVSHRTHRAFEDDLLYFLVRAVNPSPSDNASEDRIDILLQSVLASVSSNKSAILDVCSGWPYLLTRLITEHKTCNQDRQIDYVACDSVTTDRGFKTAWETQLSSLRNRGCNCIKPSSVSADVNDPGLLKLSVKYRYPELFDLIIMSNALHEIDTKTIPSLLQALLDLLKLNGHLFILDPSPDRIFHVDDWSVSSFDQLKVDWETDAVWLPPNVYGDMLTKFGCKVDINTARRSQHFWYLTAKKDREVSADMLESVLLDANSQLQRAIRSQAQEQLPKIANSRIGLRRRLASAIKDWTPQNKRQVLIEATRFFCECASQVRRIEMFEGGLQ